MSSCQTRGSSSGMRCTTHGQKWLQEMMRS